MIIFLLTLIAVLLAVLVIGGSLLYKKLDVFLTWNTRYQGADYEQTITASKIRRPHLPAKKTEKSGRVIKDVPDLIDMQEVPFEEGYDAVAALGEN